MKRKVLIVDDEINSIKVLSVAFRKEGFDPHTALNGEEASILINESRFEPPQLHR